MELLQLEIVRKICAEGSFSSWARSLGISQSTLSKAIADPFPSRRCLVAEDGSGEREWPVLSRVTAVRFSSC